MPARDRDGMIGRILGHKVCCIISGLLHLGLSLWMFISVASSDSGTTVFAVLVCLASIVFCVLLLIGILKKNKYFLMSYLIYSVLYFMLMCVACVLYMVHYYITVSWFFGALFYLLLLLLLMFVAYTYYVTTYRSQN